jgi:arylsulfatase A
VLADHLRSNGRKKLNRNAIFWHFPHYRDPVGPYSIIRSNDYKLIKHYEGPTYELFDLKEDLSETVDLSERMSEKVKELNARLTAWLTSVRAKLPRPNPDYKPRGGPGGSPI